MIVSNIAVVTASYLTAPAQIPAGGITARGSSDYSLRTKLKLMKRFIDRWFLDDPGFLDLVMI